MGNWFKKHWKKLAGAGIAIAGAFIPGAQPLIPFGAVLFGADFQVGAQVGTPIGKGAKDLVQKVKDGGVIVTGDKR